MNREIGIFSGKMWLQILVDFLQEKRAKLESKNIRTVSRYAATLLVLATRENSKGTNHPCQNCNFISPGV